MVELVIRFYKNGDCAMERVIYADECWIADPEVFKVNREEAHSAFSSTFLSLRLLYLRRIRRQSLQRMRLSTPYHRLRLRKRKRNSPMTLSL